MAAKREVAPAELLAEFPLREADQLPGFFLPATAAADMLVDHLQQLPCLRQQGVEALAHQVAHQPVGQRHVLGRRFQVDDFRLAQGVRLAGPLVLMKQRSRGDQRQVLGMVAAHAGLVVAEPQSPGLRDGDLQWLEQTLRVLMEPEDLLPALRGQAAFERVGCPLAGMDRLGLLGRFVDAERQAAVLQFGIRLGAGRGEEHHHGPLDLVAVGLLSAGLAVLAGRGDPQPAVAL